MKPYVPLGILYLAAYLEQRGTAVEVFDTTFASRPALERRLLDARPDVVGVYTNLMTKISVLAIVRFIRSRPELAHTRVVLGGPEVTHHVDRFLEHGADVIVIGEGEETTHALVGAWREGGPNAPLGDIPGLAFRDGVTRETVRTAPRGLLKSLDELPMPKREAVDLQPYLDAWRTRHGSNAVSVSTMRGCPYSCRWCSRAVYGESYRRRSANLVADEIQLIVDRYHPDSLWFVDDVFTINHSWLAALTDELARRNLRVPYECITRADRLNERAVGLLQQSGCFRVWIGAESGSQKILDAMDRRVTVEQVRDMIQLAKKHGIETGTFIMLGYPGETEADIEATIEHLKAADPDQFTITDLVSDQGDAALRRRRRAPHRSRAVGDHHRPRHPSQARALLAVLLVRDQPRGQRGQVPQARACHRKWRERRRAPRAGGGARAHQGADGARSDAHRPGAARTGRPRARPGRRRAGRRRRSHRVVSGSLAEARNAFDVAAARYDETFSP